MPAEMNFVVKQPKYIQIFLNKFWISLYTEELNYRLKFYYKTYTWYNLSNNETRTKIPQKACRLGPCTGKSTMCLKGVAVHLWWPHNNTFMPVKIMVAMVSKHQHKKEVLFRISINLNESLFIHCIKKYTYLKNG